MVAHRTSPTNIGLYLLSTIAARDFGWIGALDAVERLEATLATMNQLELFRGHFLNWYDTHDLRPLDPKYVSSVDSGNLAGHLLVLGNSCRELIQKSSIDTRMLTGLKDSMSLLREALVKNRRIRCVRIRLPGNILATPSRRLARLLDNPVPVERSGVGRAIRSNCGSAPRPWMTLHKRSSKKREVPRLRNYAFGPRPSEPASKSRSRRGYSDSRGCVWVRKKSRRWPSALWSRLLNGQLSNLISERSRHWRMRLNDLSHALRELGSLRERDCVQIPRSKSHCWRESKR